MVLRVHIHFFRAFKVLIFLTRGWLEIFSYLKECLIPPKILETIKEVCKKCPYLVTFFENNILKKCFYWKSTTKLFGSLIIMPGWNEISNLTEDKDLKQSLVLLKALSGCIDFLKMFHNIVLVFGLELFKILFLLTCYSYV